mgnify:CR=1 FL=1
MDETSTDSGSSGSWSEWLGNAADKAFGTLATQSQYNQDYRMQQLKMQQYNQYGQGYNMGQPMIGGAVGGSSTLLILGVVVVAFLVLKD